MSNRWQMIAGLLLAAAVGAGFGWVISLDSAETIKADYAATAVAGAAPQVAQARELEMLRQPPVLVAPGPDAVFDDVSTVWLEWYWRRPLNEDEVFDLRVWREGEPAYGITWTQDTTFDLRNWLLQQQPGTFFWSVAVLRQHDDGAEEIAAAAEPRRFTLTASTLTVAQVPDGFAVEMVARLPVTQPTVITFGPENALYVLFVNGEIARLLDTDQDGTYETSEIIFSDSDNQLSHAVGMAFYGEDEIMYLSDSGRISTLTDSNGDGQLDTLTPIVESLPSLQHVFHSNNGIAFGPDDKLYVGVGSTTDHGPIQVDMEASILRMNPDGSDLEVFATGFRNPYDIAFSPQGDLFTADNSPDNLSQSLQYLPPEEVIHVIEGEHYGFPDVFGHPAPGEDSRGPVTELYTSVASSGITYYGADGFPPNYHGVYVALFGTGAHYALTRGVNVGQMIVYVPLEPDGSGSYSGHWEPFVTFDNTLAPYSPIDVTVGPDGAMYFAEWTTSTLFRVTYTGDTQQAAAPPPMIDADPEVLALGEDLYLNGREGVPTCVLCHVLEPGAVGVGPSLLGVHAIAGSRVAGLDAAAYIRESIINPNAYVVSGYQVGLMYPEYAQQFTEDEIDALVTYILSLPA